MYFIQQQIAELEKIDYPLNREPDFDAFWTKARTQVAAHDPAAVMTEINDYTLNHVRMYDTVIHGLDGTPVAAWVILPAEASKNNPVPAMIQFHGGNGSRGEHPLGWLGVVLAGFAVVLPEFRNQAGITQSVTPLNRCCGTSFASLNLDGPPENHYFYHAFTDQMVAVKFTMGLPEIEASRVAVVGSSQGGGTSMIMAAQNRDIAFCMPAVPSYCAWERRVFIQSACAGDIAKYIERFPERCKDVFRMLSYFDAMNHADQIRCPVLCSCGLKDTATPPDCVYAGYNKITAPKEMNVYPFGGHASESLVNIIHALKKYLG